jgi:DNA-binding Xre family transcriptional regulator
VAEISLDVLVAKMKNKRGPLGIRQTAEQIGISAATLSRVERGNLPDLETFKRICKWVEVDPGEVLGYQPSNSSVVRVHFKKESTLDESTAKALANLLLVAQKQMLSEEEF